MSDKETARKIHNWMLGGVHAEIASCHTCDQIAELLAVECRAPAPQPAELERDLYALLRGICEDVIDWMATLSYGNIGGKEVLDHPLTKEIRLKLQRMYDHPLDNKLLIRTDQLERILDDAATPQVTQELELEWEADGRWLAEFTRFPGALAYGPSKEEAIRNAAKVLIEPEQASPTPEKCPGHECGTEIPHTTCVCVNCGKKKHVADPWHSSAPKSRNTGISLDGGKTIHSKFKND